MGKPATFTEAERAEFDRMVKRDYAHRLVRSNGRYKVVNGQGREV